MITRIKAAFIIGYADGDHRILPDAELVHENDTILFVGRDYSGPVDQEVDAGLSIVSPGFIDLNALADIDHAIFDSWHGPATRLGLVRSEAHLQSPSPVFTPDPPIDHPRPRPPAANSSKERTWMDSCRGCATTQQACSCWQARASPSCFSSSSR